MRLDHNRGMAVAQEVGVGAAVGDLIAFLDSDDVCGPLPFGKRHRSGCHPSNGSPVVRQVRTDRC